MLTEEPLSLEMTTKYDKKQQRKSLRSPQSQIVDNARFVVRKSFPGKHVLVRTLLQILSLHQFQI